MTGAIFLILVLALIALVVWTRAIVDVISGEGNLDPTGRLLLGLLLIFMAPIGLIAWLVLRGGAAEAPRLTGVLLVPVCLGLTVLLAAVVQGAGLF